MPRRTISECNEDEENDNSNRLRGESIAEYANLSSSGAGPSCSFSDDHQRPGPRRQNQDLDNSSELDSLNDQSRSNLSVQPKPNMGISELDSRTGKDRYQHKAQLVSTGNRLNDLSRIDDYQSRRENNKVNINSFLNSCGDMSSCMEDRLRVFSRDSKPKRPKPSEFMLNIDHDQKNIDLITIPQADPEIAQFEYLSHLNRHNKIKGRDDYFKNLISYNKQLQSYQDVISTSFEQAKYKFYDRFMPADLKVSKNPYKLLQYTQRNRQWKDMLSRLG